MAKFRGTHERPTRPATDSRNGLTPELGRLMTMPEVGDYLRLTPSAARQFLKRKHFRLIRIGTSLRVQRAEIERWIDTGTSDLDRQALEVVRTVRG